MLRPANRALPEVALVNRISTATEENKVKGEKRKMKK
jgi:hypothetical protein